MHDLWRSIARGGVSSCAVQLRIGDCKLHVLLLVWDVDNGLWELPSEADEQTVSDAWCPAGGAPGSCGSQADFKKSTLGELLLAWDMDSWLLQDTSLFVGELQYVSSAWIMSDNSGCPLRGGSCSSGSQTKEAES
uniref:Uncharacterized protein n=1 Tax=Eutreptiella gymnastica TaxID=73025 RepID=A0A7S1N8V3_9EUGL